MNRFGSEISAEDIVENLAFLDDWEERYRYIIELGRELSPLEAEHRSEENLIRGCQSQVWLVCRQQDSCLLFDVDSDAFIVKGLLAVVLAAYNNKTSAEILAFDIGEYFDSLDLMRHLSPTRGSGLQAMVARIRELAVAAEARG